MWWSMPRQGTQNKTPFGKSRSGVTEKLLRSQDNTNTQMGGENKTMNLRASKLIKYFHKCGRKTRLRLVALKIPYLRKKGAGKRWHVMFGSFLLHLSALGTNSANTHKGEGGANKRLVISTAAKTAEVERLNCRKVAMQCACVCDGRWMTATRQRRNPEYFLKYVYYQRKKKGKRRRQGTQERKSTVKWNISKDTTQCQTYKAKSSLFF